jgi:hypothetical protein
MAGHSFWMKQIQNCAIVSFKKTRLLNREEYPLFCDVRRLCKETTVPRYFVAPQVSFAELFAVDGEGSAPGLNSVRSDLAIIGRTGLPLVMIEYHGSGHFGDDDDDRALVELRDEFKATVCKKSGVPQVVITEAEEPSVWRDKIEAAISSKRGSRRAWQRQRDAA